MQRFLKMKPPLYGTEPDRRFCWDVHNIRLRGRECMLAVHCHSRYAFVLWDVSPFQWGDITGLFREGLADSLHGAGFAPEAVDRYLQKAGDIDLTRTHGRREVAFLNRAWEDVLALDFCLDLSSTAQPLLDHAVNTKSSRCAFFPGLAPAEARLRDCLNHKPDFA